MSEREAFEEYLLVAEDWPESTIERDDTGAYTHDDTIFAWFMWQASAANQQARIEFLEKALEQAVDKGGITIEDWESWGGKGLYLRAFGHPESAEMYSELAAYLKEKQ